MIYSSINSNFNIEDYHKVIKDAIVFFKTTDFSKIDEGEYELEGRDIFFQVKDIMTKPIKVAKPEIHKKYIDVQFLYKGKERIGVVYDTGNNQISEDYLKERDLLFYKDVENETLINMTEGDFCVFFPSDVHRPACESDGQSMIRKVVYKINVDLLNK
jgi:YhcH/YjgK/YiaL family protein